MLKMTFTCVRACKQQCDGVYIVYRCMYMYVHAPALSTIDSLKLVDN